MKNFIATLTILAIFVTLTACQSTTNAATSSESSADAAEIDRDVDAALHKLFESTPLASELREKAVGILMFPDVLKAGFIVGAQYGEGALRQNGKTTGYYSTVSASYGLQAGVQQFGYALFFMNDEALAYLDKSSGWEIGSGPSVVVLDEGFAKSMSTTTLTEDVYAFTFDQQGLMAGLGLQGTKITRINP
jgi:lipid-binding SYLF domain-containing protein